jgi:hypothetical protein
VTCAVALAASAGSLSAQTFEAQVGRFYDSDGWTLYRLGLSRPLIGPLGTTFHGDYLSAVGDTDGGFAGIGLDLTAFKTGGQGPYAVLGVGGGIGSPHSGSFDSFWGSWSAGAGYQLVPASILRVGVEGRWREMSLDHRDGFELAAGLSIGLGGGREKPAPRPPARDIAAPAGDSASLPPLSTTAPGGGPAEAGSGTPLAQAVIATATEVMGRPYEYGGTGEAGGGFDCSGLIQYAYAQHGITLPRRSVEQAREGREVATRLAQLRPGDLLTFSNRGGPVTHVGLYIGDGRFIHSATRGVQVSNLSAEDPYGRWWFTRWVGVRRIVE